MKPDGYIYCEVRKGIYGLKQVDHIDFDNLVKLLAPHRYFPVQESPGSWKHQTQPTVFTLCVDDFGRKANSIEDAHHLINDIKKHLKFSINWGGKHYLDLTLDWNYKNITLIYPCLDTSQPHCKNSITNHQHVPKTPHIHGINLFMAHISN